MKLNWNIFIFNDFSGVEKFNDEKEGKLNLNAP